MYLYGFLAGAACGIVHVRAAHHLHVQVLWWSSLIVNPPQVPVLHPGLKPRNIK